jgi:hypothetical protein
MFSAAKARWQAFLQQPFARLVRHATNRIFAGGEGVEPGDLDMSIGAVLAVLAAPGAFVSIMLSERYGSLFRWLRGQPAGFDLYAVSVPDEYFFIVLAMVSTAAVAVWKWDRLLPDRRDFLNLAALPLPNRTFFFANLASIVALAVLLSLDVNAVSCVLFPVFVTFQATFSAFLEFLVTHAAAVFLAGAFGFLSVFAILGVMLAVLPFGVFGRISFYVRCAILFLLGSLLATGLSVPNKFPALASASRPWSRVPPPAWFLGFCESIRGRHQFVFASLASAAVWALSLALFLSIAAFSLGYRRSYLRSAEIGHSSAPGGPRFSFAFRLLDALLLRTPLERASYPFVLRALFRSQEQAFVLGSFATFGVVLASQDLFQVVAPGVSRTVIPSPSILSVPFVFGFFLILGLYWAFSIPAHLRSNWLFRFHVDAARHKSASLARKVVFTFLVPLLFAPCLGIYSWFWNWRVGLLHTALVIAWCTLLLEGLLVRFRKIPFTCSVPGFKSHAIMTAVLLLFGFFLFTSVTATVESWALGDPVYFVIFSPVVGGSLFLFCRQRKGLIESDRRLIFEEKSAPVVEAMNLLR